MINRTALLLSCAFLTLSFTTPAYAQEAYTPPPMFGEEEASKPITTQTPPANTPDTQPKMPASESLLGEENIPSPSIKSDPRPAVMLPEAERSKPILDEKPKQQSKPVPPAKIKPDKVEKPKEAPKTVQKKTEKEPVKKEADKKEIEKKEPKPATSQQSKKTGPKMPAVPARPVEQESLPEIVKMPPPAQLPPVDNTTKLQDKALEQKMVTPSAEALLDQIEETPAAKNSGLFQNENAVAPSVKKDVLSALPEEKTKDASGTTQLEKVTLRFKPNLSDLSSELVGMLTSDVLPKLQANKAARVQLQAYASATEDDGQSAARRISLARALSVRGWLIDKGIDASRMDVRALGMNTNQEPVDRVDLVFVTSP